MICVFGVGDIHAEASDAISIALPGEEITARIPREKWSWYESSDEASEPAVRTVDLCILLAPCLVGCPRDDSVEGRSLRDGVVDVTLRIT